MGSVWYGMREDGAECAIKCMLAKYVSVPDYREFFDAEAKAMKRLNHPSVVRIMGNTFTDSKGNLYLPMEYIQGETIEQRIKRTGVPFDEEEAVAIMAAVLDAFTYIHAQGQIHRDIKPSNIMLRPDGSICVIDFGIAKDIKTSTGKTVGRQVGTSGYMSPEQISALNIDHRTDIYSLGCLLFYMLTAQHAITKKTNDYETMYAIQKADFPSVRAFNPAVSQHVEEVIYKATDKDMRRRYQSAEEFKNALTGSAPQIVESVSDEPHSTERWRITVGRKEQDIVIPNQYVSTYHLDIDLDAVWTIERQLIIRSATVTDHSTNGTGINGRYLHNASLQLDLQEVPEILLAGRAECTVDWNEVRRVLIAKITKNDDRIPDSKPETGPKETDKSQTVANNQTYIGLIILCFFVPIVGWILYGVERRDNINKARQAFIAAWVGFGLGMCMQTILFLLTL